jgi:hypothetical protein
MFGTSKEVRMVKARESKIRTQMVRLLSKREAVEEPDIIIRRWTAP